MIRQAVILICILAAVVVLSFLQGRRFERLYGACAKSAPAAVTTEISRQKAECRKQGAVREDLRLPAVAKQAGLPRGR